MRRAVGCLWVLSAACKASPEAVLSLDEAIVGTFQKFEGTDEEISSVMRGLETQLYTHMEVDAKDTLKRSVSQSLLSKEDVALPGAPDRDPADALTVSTAWGSPFGVDDHAALTVRDDQCNLEATSPAPSDYVREFLEGKDCWPTRDCTWLKTTQDVIKHYTGNIVPPIPYVFLKDFRWVDLNLGLKDAEGERWAYVARSYDPGSFSSENGKNTIWQSYTIEVWFPRDGDGFRWGGSGMTPPSEDAGDSSGGGSLRFLGLWTDTEVALSDDPSVLAGTIRWGMDQNYKTVDAFLEDPTKTCAKE